MINEPGGCSVDSPLVNTSKLKPEELTETSADGITEIPNNTAEPPKKMIL